MLVDAWAPPSDKWAAGPRFLTGPSSSQEFQFGSTPEITALIKGKKNHTIISTGEEKAFAKAHYLFIIQ